MGYVDVNSASGAQIGVCDVHRLVDGDTRPRLVQWCGICQAWICGECSGNWAKRAQAMMLRRMGY